METKDTKREGAFRRARMVSRFRFSF